MPDTHILRFKVVSVECSSMADGQMYTINYRRGDTNRSTPCYSAQGGVVDFSSMPEGAAILHFKSGRQVGRRYAPKLVEFRVDEYTKGSPRRTVGEVDVDCSLVMGNNDTGRGIETQSFRMYGVMATIKVAFLVYREHSLPPVFGDLIPAVPANEAAPVAAIKGSIKKMSREEAMTLLISLETMLERQKVMRESGTSQPTNPMEARLQELEQKRKQLTASQGLATTVVTARCRDIVAAQFLATARRHRNNFVGETAAYLRQMALTSGIPTATIEAMIGGGAAPGAGGGAGAGAADQLARVTTRKVELRAQLSKLEEEQRVLGRLQERTDVTEQLIANLNKVSTLESQLKILEESEASIRASNEKQQQAQQVHTNTPLGREAKQINERIQELNQERKQLEPKIQHMTTVASGHVLAWARAKNPPEPDTTATATTEGGVAKAKPGRTTVDDLFGDAAPPPMLDEDQRKQILDAFHNMKATAPSAHQDALPTSSDFGADAPSRAAPKQSGGFRDPLRPEGLSRNMFSADASPSSEEASATNFFKMRETFQFGAAPSALQVAGRGEDEHFVTSAVREVPQQQQPAPTHEAPAVDPYYDEMDDFTPQAATTTAAATMDVGGAGGGLFGFNFGGGESSGAGAGGAVPRPVYNFGADGNEGEEDHHAPARPAGLGTYDFGSGAPTGGYGQSRLPEYNFN